MRIVFVAGVKLRERETGRRRRRRRRSTSVVVSFLRLDLKARSYTHAKKKITNSFSEEERTKELLVIHIISFKLNTFQMLMSTHINV